MFVKGLRKACDYGTGNLAFTVCFVEVVVHGGAMPDRENLSWMEDEFYLAVDRNERIALVFSAMFC